MSNLRTSLSWATHRYARRQLRTFILFKDNKWTIFRNLFSKETIILTDFEKWRVIRAGVGGVGDKPAYHTC